MSYPYSTRASNSSSLAWIERTIHCVHKLTQPRLGIKWAERINFQGTCTASKSL